MNFDKEDFEENGGKNYAFGKKFKHTLDSDEEDDETEVAKYNVMDTERIQGTEKSTIDFDDDIKITPFNMDEELETGHFDREGTYIFKKEDEIRDSWLDNIDWANINSHANKKFKKQQDDESDDENEKNSEKIDYQTLYEKIIELIEPKESIKKAIQRYGKECKHIRKGIKRKTGENNISDESVIKAKESSEKMNKLIALADQILGNGDMEIYERKYEELQLHLKKYKKLQSSPESDMFSDDFKPSASSSFAIASSSSSKIEPLKNEVQWEYKWEDKEDAQIYGPFSSSDMLSWANQGYFNSGVFVRKKNQSDAKFYNSKRIDFDLYV